MPHILPTTKLAPTRFNPKILVTYGMPKVGKTTAMATLDSCLIMDMEEGAVSIEALRLPIKYIDGPTIYNEKKELIAMSLNTFISEMWVYAKEFMAANPGKKPPYLYKRIAIDTMDKFEEMCLISALAKYKNSVLGKNFEGDSLTDLPKGAGYYYLRVEIMEQIDRLAPFCETLILNAHTKDKIIDKGGLEFTSKDISLTGKIAGMVCAKADVIIYWYREPNKPLMASLETSEDGGVMGARKFPHLVDLLGKKFVFSWDKILIDTSKPV